MSVRASDEATVDLSRSALRASAQRGPSLANAEVAGAYHEHGGAVYRAASRVCGLSMAEDITQEVFLHLWRHPEQFDPARGTLRALLVTIAHHKAIDLTRSEGSRRTREKKDFGSSARHRSEGLDEAFLAHEEAERIAGAVRRLPARERDALLASYYRSRTYKEAAEALGEPEGTTKSRIRSGLQRLGVALADYKVDAAVTVSAK